MGLKAINLPDITIYDGATKRCKLDNASMLCELGNTDTTLTTNAKGVFDDPPVLAIGTETTVTVTVSKTGYKTVKVTPKVTWDGDSGLIGVKSIYMTKK